MLHFFSWISFFFSFYVPYQYTLISSPSPFFFVGLFFVIPTLSQQLIKKGESENMQEKMKTAELFLNFWVLQWLVKVTEQRSVHK